MTATSTPPASSGRASLLEIHTWDPPEVRQIKEVINAVGECDFASLVPLLPLVLNLKGQPYTLKDHFPFEPLFSTRRPPIVTLKSGRQCGKSASLRAEGIMSHLTTPYLSTLYVTPLFEMIRRFSSDMSLLIEESPLKHLLRAKDSVLHKIFANKSQMFFSFAFLDATRCRGISAGRNVGDEIQDLDPTHLPVIHETMSAEANPQILYAGTPKTMEGTLQGVWVDSSQAEWLIKCQACNYWNIPSLAHDLDKMIGSAWEDVSEERPGVVCARCGKPINPRTGHFEHARPELRFEHAGYHIPQIILPFHYANPRKWKLLLHKRAGGSNFTPARFYNEVLGESYDSGAKLVSQTDIKAACTLPWENDLRAALKAYNPDNYVQRVLGVDWGAGGEKEVSFTTLAVCGMLPTGQVHVIYGEKSLTPTAHMEEAERCLDLMQRFNCTHIAHDYTGAGALRETFMVQKGLRYRQLVPLAYVRAASGNLMRSVPATEIHPRDHYRVDKSRSLTTVAAAIKTGLIRFFRYDWKSREEPGLLNDFMALVEDKVQSRTAGDIYTVIRHPHMSDDFAHAVNLAVCTMWYTTKSWPTFVTAI